MINENDQEVIFLRQVGQYTRELTKMNIEDAGLPVQISGNLEKGLKKTGYSLVGSHSAVKLCTWLKKGMTGDGLCYKYMFYGIDSRACMQMSSSMVCANRCVFCWRHYDTPVSFDWKWKSDPPENVLEGSLKAQARLVKSLRGYPGAIWELVEQNRENVKHAALSLVGESIMYPHVNRLVDLMHKRRISTFVVTNGQLPDLLRALTTVTQLYLSVDAPDKERLKAIDRPLAVGLEEPWNRLLACLDILREERKERTCIRITAIKNYNMDDCIEYAKLVHRGKPDFIEVKGVTFAGDVRSRGELGWDDIPYADEVVAFSKDLLTALGEEYLIMTAHFPSRCVCFARREYLDTSSGVWNSWINFDGFFRHTDLIREGDASEKAKSKPELLRDRFNSPLPAESLVDIVADCPKRASKGDVRSD